MGNRPRIYDPFRAGSFAGAKEGGISMIVEWLYWSARGGLLVVMLCGKGLAEEGMGSRFHLMIRVDFWPSIPTPIARVRGTRSVYGNVMIILTIDNDHYVLSKYDLI